MEAARPGPRAHADAVMGHAGQGDAAGGEEGGDALDEERIEQLGRLHPEVGKGVVVHRDPAGEPAVGVVLGARPIERPGAADSLRGRVQPEADEDRRVDRGAATVALDGPDPRVEGRQVEALDEGPDEARPVVVRQKALEIRWAERDLVALRALEPGASPTPGSFVVGSAGGRSNSSSMTGIVPVRAC